MYLSRPLQSLARLGQKVTHWQWCLAGVLHCLSVIQLFFLPWLILRSPCDWFWSAHSDIGDICGNAYERSHLLSQQSALMLMYREIFARHQRILWGHITLTVNITVSCRLLPRRILVNSTTESTFSENEFFLPWCRLLLWGERKLLRMGKFNMRVTCAEACAYI